MWFLSAQFSVFYVFFFKQKTAYEMRISDWSSDVCSSDLPDSYIEEYGAEAFRATAAEAIPLSRFMLDELASRHALNEAEGRAACAHEAKPQIGRASCRERVCQYV